MKYYLMKPDIYADHGVTEDPEEVENGLFLRGNRILQALTLPLVFQVSNTKKDPPRHYSESSIPGWSCRFHDVIASSGVGNVDAYKAELVNSTGRLRWKGYRAINIVGLLACADMKASEYAVIAGSSDGVPLVDFDRLVLAASKINGLHVFRLAQDPGPIVISGRILTALRAAAPKKGWGISVTPVDEVR